MLPLIRIVFLTAAVISGPVQSAFANAATATGIDPSSMDLTKLIECGTYDVPSYNGFAMWLTGPKRADAERHLGLTEEPSDNLLLKAYRLSTPITVFGRQTSRVVFASSGPLAVLDANPRSVADQLGVTAAVDTSEKFLGEKEISSTKEPLPNSDTVLHTRVSLDVSTVINLPGKTLAGCSYSIEVE